MILRIKMVVASLRCQREIERRQYVSRRLHLATGEPEFGDQEVVIPSMPASPQFHDGGKNRFCAACRKIKRLCQSRLRTHQDWRS